MNKQVRRKKKRTANQNIHRAVKNGKSVYRKRKHSKSQSVRNQRLCIAIGLGLIFILMIQCVILKQQKQEKEHKIFPQCFPSVCTD